MLKAMHFAKDQGDIAGSATDRLTSFSIQINQSCHSCYLMTSSWPMALACPITYANDNPVSSDDSPHQG